MKKRKRRIEQICAIEREYEVASIAVADLDRRFRENPSFLAAERLRSQDFQHFRDNLEGTYIIRMFACFEADLREAWSHCFKRRTHPKMKDLIDSISAKVYTSEDFRSATHRVREQRNRLVHEEDGGTLLIGLVEARGHLCRFFSLLPLDW